MPTDTEHDWETIAARVGLVPEGLSSLQAAYDEGVAQGLVAARRQVVGCVQQAEVWAGTGDAKSTPFFQALVERFDASGISSPGLRATLAARAESATAAYASFARYLIDEYSPHASEHDPVGAERYAVWARVFNGNLFQPSLKRTRGLGFVPTASSTRCAWSASGSCRASRSRR